MCLNKSPKLRAFCALSKQLRGLVFLPKACDYYTISAPWQVGGIPCDDSVRKKILNAFHSSKTERLRIFHVAFLAGLLGSKVVTEMDRQMRPYYLATSFSWTRITRFLHLGYIRDAGYVPSFPNTFPQLAERTRTTTPAVTTAMLTNLYTELECRRDIYRATHGALSICQPLSAGFRNLIM